MLTVGTRLGPYEIQDLLGSGGMGEVYRARDPRLGRDVAIKILPAAISSDSERLRRFEQEARATAALNHPNILAVYDIGTDSTATYVVSELLDGQTLRGILSESGALPLRKAIDYAVQIAKGLAAAHDKGIVHRDLKPENLFITSDGHAKILDFGLAKLLNPADGPSLSVLPTTPLPTNPGVILGTVGYMSPEQVRGRTVDHRSDIFSFGAVLYEMLSGRRAFAAESPAETMTAIVKNETAELSTNGRPIPPGVERIVARCLEKTPDARFQSPKDLAFALEAVSSSSQPTTSVASRSGMTTRERLAWGLAGVLAIASAAALAFAFTRPKPPEERVLRYTLPWPPKMTLPRGGNIDWIAVSPDGRRLALIARSATTSTIWLRDLDSSVLRMLPGTEGAISVFWSPDSQWLGYIGNGGSVLQKIAVSGGRPITLSDMPLFTASGGSWNQFGDIILGTVRGPILRVSDRGGEPTPASKNDSQKNELGHRWPQFLPDGRHFLFFVSGARELALGSLDEPGHSVIARTESRATYAPPGNLLYVRDGSLVRVSFDINALKVSGEPTAVADHVLNSTASGAASFSASTNGILTYLPGVGFTSGGWTGTGRLVWFSRMGDALGPVAEPGDYRNPRLSPDGKQLLVEKDDEGISDIWIFDLSRGAAAPGSPFTTAPLHGQQGVWSRDGSRIAFVVGQPGPATIYQKRSSGVGKEEVLVKVENGAAPNDWAPDERLLYHVGFAQPPTSLQLLEPDGHSRPVVSSKFVDIDGRFSPDGKWLAYVSTRSGHPEVYLQDFPNATQVKPISVGGGVQPLWRHDGKELFYLSLDGALMAVSLTLAGEPVITAPQKLFPTNIVAGGGVIGSGIHHQYDATADGQRFLVLTADETSESPVNVVVNWQEATQK
jgi:eukaryotic-like serine/threonine-protein kinase